MEPCLFRHGKRGRPGTCGRGGAASMEPCLFRHGKHVTAGTSDANEIGFNGAMSFQTW